MEMRTGKTKVTLDEFGELEHAGEVKHLLVVAPAGVYRTWIADAEKHLSDDLQRRAKLLLWDSKATPKEKVALVEAIREPCPKILLVNVEALSTVEAVQKLCAGFIKRAPTMMVVDESTVIKSHDANRTKFCLAAAPHCKVRRILSGLPSPQSPLDLFSQFAFLHPDILGFARFNEFRARYATMKKVKTFNKRTGAVRMVDVVDGYQNLPELQAKVAKHSFRVLLRDCADLPEKIYMRRDVALTDTQRALYTSLVASATAALMDEKQKVGRVTATMVITQMLRLHQFLAGHAKTDDGRTIDVSENKTEEMMAAIGECTSKAIIWVAYDTDVHKVTKKLREVYGPNSVARFWGGNRDTREQEEHAFKTDPACRFMVATAASGGRGRTWSVADLVIYYSNTFHLEHRMQSEERPQAIGKTTNTLYIDLVCRGTVEEKILHSLRGKIDLSNAVTGDKFKDWIV